MTLCSIDKFDPRLEMVFVVIEETSFWKSILQNESSEEDIFSADFPSYQENECSYVHGISGTSCKGRICLTKEYTSSEHFPSKQQ